MPRPVWKPGLLIASHVAAAVLFGSWLLPPTRALWDRLDEAVFRFFNATLESGEWWQLFWAAANHRSVDLLSGGLGALVVFWWLWGASREVQSRRIAALGALAVPLLAVPFTVAIVVRKVAIFERLSPSLVYDGAFRLSEAVTAFKTKDAAGHAFPGDHTFILLSVALFYSYLAPRKFAAVSLILAAVFSMPRVVSGAHWLTDDLVGGAAMALVVTAWVLATPFGYHLSNVFLPAVSRVIGVLPDWLWIPSRPRQGT